MPVPDHYKDDTNEFFFRMQNLRKNYITNLLVFLLQSFFFLSILLMLIVTIFVMPSKPIVYGYFAWFKHAFFIIFWIGINQFKKKLPLYTSSVAKAVKEFEDITDARIIIQNSKSSIIFYFKKEEYLELSRESNVTKKHLEIYRFVSKSENDLDHILRSSTNKPPLLSDRREVPLLTADAQKPAAKVHRRHRPQRLEIQRNEAGRRAVRVGLT